MRASLLAVRERVSIKLNQLDRLLPHADLILHQKVHELVAVDQRDGRGPGLERRVARAPGERACGGPDLLTPAAEDAILFAKVAEGRDKVTEGADGRW